MRLAVVALLAACTPAVQAPKPPDPPLPLWSEVHAGKLANGLTYYVLPHAMPARRAYAWLVVQAGSANEDDDQRGLAHLVEHLAFAGTKRFAGHAIESYLASIGMDVGGDLNAHTTYDQTTFELTVPTDRAEYVDTAIAMLRDFAGDVTFDDDGLARERKIVHEEWRQTVGAGRRAFDQQLRAVFAGTRYADRDVIGSPDIVETASRDTIMRFYRDWYRADRMAVIVVGDVDVAAVEARVRDELGTLPAPGPARALRPAKREPGTRISVAVDAEAPTSMVAIVNVIAARALASRSDVRRRLVERLYETILTWRLDGQSGFVTTPYRRAVASFDKLTRDSDAFVRLAASKVTLVDDSLAALVREQVRTDRFPVTPRELELAKLTIAKLYDDDGGPRDSKSFVAELARHFTTGEYMVGGVAERALVAELLATITAAEVAKAPDPFVRGGDRTILIAAPEVVDLPSRERVVEILAQTEARAVGAWRGPGEVKPLMDAPPAAGAISSERAIDAIGAVEWVLSNRIRVVVKRTDFQPGSFVLEAISPGGFAMVDDADIPEATFATEIAQLGGLGNRDAGAVAQALIGKTARATAALERDSESISGGGATRDVETVLQLVYLRMAAWPRVDERAIATWKANLPDRVADARKRVEVAFELAVDDELYQNNVRHTTPRPDRLAHLDTDKALAIYGERFHDASDFVFVFVGDVDPVALRPLVARYLASLPTTGRVDTPPDRNVRMVPGAVSRTFHHGREPRAQVRLVFHGDVAWSRDDANDLDILAHVLDTRLREVLREDKGGVYNVGVRPTFARGAHPEYALRIGFACDPARADELVQATLDELAALKRHVPDELIANLRQAYARTRETEQRDNKLWATELAGAYLRRDDPAHVADDAAGRITAANIQAAAAKFADPSQYARFVLLPE